MNITINHIPYSTPRNRRPNIKMKPKAITIHSTANPKSDASGERGWLTNPTNTRTASWHYVVDSEGTIIEAIPPTEVAWHATDGRGQGNMSTIAIEICESGDQSKAMAHAIQLVAYLMKKHGITDIKRHWDFYKAKTCPRIMYDRGTWETWAWFTGECHQAHKALTAPAKPAVNTNASTHIVKSGDTLWDIAMAYGVTVKQLEALNPSVDAKTLQIGSELIVKGTAPVKPKPAPTKPSYTLPTGTYKYGSRGTAVSRIQESLNKLYFKCGAVDGSFGHQTLDALKRFQSVYTPYDVDGIYGVKTRTAMLKQLNK